MFLPRKFGQVRNFVANTHTHAPVREQIVPATSHDPLLRSKCLPMTYRAGPLPARLEFEHIKVVAPANREEHPRLSAEKRRNDAAKVGINGWALEIVAGGELIRSMIQALNEAEFRQTPAIS